MQLEKKKEEKVNRQGYIQYHQDLWTCGFPCSQILQLNERRWCYFCQNEWEWPKTQFKMGFERRASNVI
jgi:hypothetical protein